MTLPEGSLEIFENRNFDTVKQRKQNCVDDMNKTVENVNNHFGAVEASVNDVTKYGSAISDLESRVIVTEAYIKKSKDNLSQLSSSSTSTTNAQKYIYCMQQYVNGVSSSSTCN